MWGAVVCPTLLLTCYSAQQDDAQKEILQSDAILKVQYKQQSFHIAPHNSIEGVVWLSRAAPSSSGNAIKTLWTAWQALNVDDKTGVETLIKYFFDEVCRRRWAWASESKLNVFLVIHVCSIHTRIAQCLVLFQIVVKDITRTTLKMNSKLLVILASRLAPQKHLDSPQTCTHPQTCYWGNMHTCRSHLTK